MGSVLYWIKWQASVSNQTNSVIQTLHLSTELFIVVRIYCTLKYNTVTIIMMWLVWWSGSPVLPSSLFLPPSTSLYTSLLPLTHHEVVVMPVLEEGPLQLCVLDKQQIQCTSHTEYVIPFNHQKLQARDQVKSRCYKHVSQIIISSSPNVLLPIHMYWYTHDILFLYSTTDNVCYQQLLKG